MRRTVPPRRTALFLAFAWLMAACSAAGPVPIRMNEDACDFCRMTISDSRFGGEAVTATGRRHTFDSIECLVSWSRTASAKDTRALYVIDTQHPGSFVAADSAGFLKAGFMKSPMGRGLVAFASPQRAEEQRAMLGGTVMTWRELLADTTQTTAPGAP